MASSHLKALIRKNGILWRRNIICSLMEIAVPLIFCLLFKLFRDQNPPKDIPETSFYKHMRVLPTVPVSYNLKDCTQAGNPDAGGAVGLAPSTDPFILELQSYFTSNSYLQLY